MDNVTYNRALWDRYADRWNDPAFRLAYTDAPEDADAFEVIGDEWGRRGDVDEIVREYILPFVDSDSTVGEIGCGGGRVARRVVDHVGLLYCFDISPRMLDKARRVLPEAHVRFVLLEGARLPEELTATLDFVYAFDVFLHLDLYVMWRYFQDITRVLRPGGRALVHTTNLTSDVGWENFTKFDHYRVETHFYVSPETVRTLASRAGLRIVRESATDGRAANFYLARDFLAVLEKPSHPEPLPGVA